MRQLYVLSEDFDHKGRRLIGVLTELKRANISQRDGKYRFEYKLGGAARPPDICIQISVMPDLTKVYEGGDIKPFIDLMVNCPEGNPYERSLIQNVGLSVFDEWEMMKYYGSADMSRYDCGFLFEILPEGVITFE